MNFEKRLKSILKQHPSLKVVRVVGSSIPSLVSTTKPWPDGRSCLKDPSTGNGRDACRVLYEAWAGVTLDREDKLSKGCDHEGCCAPWCHYISA